MPSCFWYILRLSINHVLTSNYFSCVSLINAPNLLNCISLAYTLYMWIWHAFLFWYILHLPITPCSYIKLLFLCILRLSLMMRQSRAWVNMRRNTLIKNAISSSPHDSQETASLNEDIERSSVPEDRTSPTPPSQVLALTSQCDMWLHVAYGV